MKKALKYLGITVGAIIVIILLAVATIAFKPLPNYQNDVQVHELKIDVSPARVERGQNLSMVLCNHCHGTKNGKLEGGLMEDQTAFGDIYGSNITQHPDYGIGKYTDGELYRLLRTGVKKDGGLALPMMMRFPKASEEDIYSIIAFLRSDRPDVQPSDNIVPPFKPTFLAKMLYTVAFKPIPYPVGPISHPSKDNPSVYGKYLATNVLQCFDCHSESFETVNLVNPEQTPGFFGGGNKLYLPQKMQDTLVVPNITFHEKEGIGSWSETDFISAVKWGKKPDGNPFSYPMMPYSFLDTVEVKAIYQYLSEVPRLPNPGPEMAGQ